MSSFSIHFLFCSFLMVQGIWYEASPVLGKLYLQPRIHSYLLKALNINSGFGAKATAFSRGTISTKTIAQQIRVMRWEEIKTQIP